MAKGVKVAAMGGSLRLVQVRGDVLTYIMSQDTKTTGQVLRAEEQERCWKLVRFTQAQILGELESIRAGIWLSV